MKAALLLLTATGLIGLAIYYFRPHQPLDPDKTITSIVVLKSARKMQVFSGDELLKTYTIALGREPVGKKEYEGDKKTPEGIYTIDDKNPNSGYHRNLGVSYPQAEDRKHAESLGKSPGGLIKIHGLRNGMGAIGRFHRWQDWTMGCIAVTNEEVEELFELVPIGTPIDIRP
ncbi:MAG: L,D-transpeptidase family protein [Bacteroidota bacterium]